MLIVKEVLILICFRGIISLIRFRINNNFVYIACLLTYPNYYIKGDSV